MSRYSLDRFEGPFAVLVSERGEELQVPAASLALLTPPIKEGEMLAPLGGQWVRHETETTARRQKNAALLAALCHRGGQNRP